MELLFESGQLKATQRTRNIMSSKRSDGYPCNQYYVQWCATFGVFILMMQVGLYIGWGSPNIARLRMEDSPIHLTDDQVTLLISAVTIGAAIGSVVGSLSLAFMGSRKTVLLTLFVMSISWICLIVADSAEWIFASRFIGGLPCAMSYCCFSLFVGEISQAKIRGTLISVAVLGSPIGTVVGTAAETYLSMKLTSSLYLAQAIIGMVLLFWLKDTPYYLVSEGRHRKAEHSIMFYQQVCNLDEEMKEIQNFVENEERQSILDKLKEFKNPVFRKSIILVFILFGLPHVGGFTVILSYMQVILDSAKFDLIKSDESVIYINIISVVSSILSMNLIDKLGRRFLLLFSSIGVITSLIALGVHFHLTNSGTDPKSMQWLPIGSLILYVITYSAGFNSVPSTVLSEIFPEKMKSTASFLATLGVSLFGLLVANIYQPIIDSLGQEYPFWIFAALSVFLLSIILYLLPETKGKSFQEIQDILRRK